MNKNCIECGKPITKKKCYKFCCAKCRQKNTNRRWYQNQKLWSQNKRGAYSKNKVLCLICGKYYVQVGSHIVQTHNITARKYREQYDLPVKRGILPLWYRKIKRDLAIENKTADNIKKDNGFRFKKGDKRAKENTFFKGRYA